MRIGYQLHCKGKYYYFNQEKTLFSKSIYINKEDITEDVIDKFKDSCAEGGELYDLEKSSMRITILEVNIIE